MDPYKRIEELEREVGQLQARVNALEAGEDPAVASNGFASDLPGPAGARGSGRHAWLTRGATALLMLLLAAAAMSVAGGELADNAPLLTLTALALLALMADGIRRAPPFTWLAMVAVALAYGLYLRPPRDTGIAEGRYFLLANLVLFAMFLTGSLAAGAPRIGVSRYGRRLAVLALFNTLLCVLLWYGPFVRVYPDWDWTVWAGLAAMSALLARTSETPGPRPNYLFQVFVAQSAVFTVAAMWTLLRNDWVWPALALLCLSMVWAYRWSGIVSLKVLELFLLLAVFIGTLAWLRPLGWVDESGARSGANWYECGATAGILLVIAWVYEHLVRRRGRGHRMTSGQWYLSETMLDATSGTAAMLHAAAGALLILALITVNRAGTPSLPFMLMAAAAALAVMGLLLRTPQIAVGGMLFLVAAHVDYHFLLRMDPQTFEGQPHYLTLTLLFAAVTFLGAYRWEHYLERFRGASVWRHYAVASIPYLLASLLLCTLAARTLPGLYGPVVQTALGAAILLAGVVLAAPSVQAAALAAVAFGAITFFWRVYDGAGAAPNGRFLFFLLLMLVACAVAEQVLRMFQRREPRLLPFNAVARTLLVVLSGATGLLSLSAWSSGFWLSCYWLGFGAVLLAAGVLLFQRRYYWMGLLVSGLGIVRAVLYDLLRLPDFVRHQAFLGVVLVLALVVLTIASTRSGDRSLRETWGR